MPAGVSDEESAASHGGENRNIRDQGLNAEQELAVLAWDPNPANALLNFEDEPEQLH